MVTDVGEIIQFRSKAQRDLTKRTLTLIDVSNYSIELTLWGDKASHSIF